MMSLLAGCDSMETLSRSARAVVEMLTFEPGAWMAPSISTEPAFNAREPFPGRKRLEPAGRVIVPLLESEKLLNPAAPRVESASSVTPTSRDGRIDVGAVVPVAVGLNDPRSSVTDPTSSMLGAAKLARLPAAVTCGTAPLSPRMRVPPAGGALRWNNPDVVLASI